MSDERLSRGPGADDDARLLDAAVRERLRAASADARLPRRLRLTDWQRSTVVRIAARLVRAVEDELRSALAADPAVVARPGLHAAFSSAHVEIAEPILDRSGAHLDTALLSAILRRVEEHRQVRSRPGGEAPLLRELIADPDEQVAELAMSILIAHSRRFDGFAEPVAARTELSAELEHRLVWRVAAALRFYMTDRHDVPPPEADRMIVAAAQQLLGAYDEGDSLEARSLRLARRLRERGRLDERFLERSLGEASLPMFLACISVRGGISPASAWEILFDPSRRGPAILLKAIGIGRAAAASILLGLSGEEAEVEGELNLFETLAADEAREMLRLWRVDPSYRDALFEVAA